MDALSEVGMQAETTKAAAQNKAYPPKLSKAVKKANRSVQRHYDEVNVLVTAFGVRLSATVFKSFHILTTCSVPMAVQN